jgi:SAM-dependent methyltransferase
MSDLNTVERSAPAAGGTAGVYQRLLDGVWWRWRFVLVPRLKRLFGVRDVQWARVVSDRQAEAFVRTLPFERFDVVEISAGSDRWRRLGFKSYCSTTYPSFDICAGPLQADSFDLVIAEQVFEHLHWPYRAARHAWQMLRPGGWFLVATPFMLRVHGYPDDCSRWTELGLKCLLVESGFPADRITTGSWGNRACVKANFRRFPSWIPWWHSLKNESLYPVVVWAFAQKATAAVDAA